MSSVVVVQHSVQYTQTGIKRTYARTPRFKHFINKNEPSSRWYPSRELKNEEKKIRYHFTSCRLYISSFEFGWTGLRSMLKICYRNKMKNKKQLHIKLKFQQYCCRKCWATSHAYTYYTQIHSSISCNTHHNSKPFNFLNTEYENVQSAQRWARKKSDAQYKEDVQRTRE